MRFRTMSELSEALRGIAEISNGTVKVLEETPFRGPFLDRLAYTAVFGEPVELKGTARWLIKTAAPQLGVHIASIQDLYSAIGRRECGGFTVPAINVRGLSYDFARAAVRAAKRHRVGAYIFEIAKSEIGYTFQPPHEYAPVVIAAAIREGHSGPLFVQGDHFQANAKKYKEDPRKEVEGLRQLIRWAIAAGFLNIDIDSSTLVDLSFPDVVEQQRPNFEVAAELTATIRSLEPAGVSVSVGGEIGEVGGKNSTVEEFRVFMDHYLAALERKAGPVRGISKISIQTGTSHGGVPLPDGRIAKVAIDFDAIEKISREAREKYGLSGAVQHGASTLPAEVFDRFPKAGAVEIHLATEFQNMIFDEIPEDLRQETYAWVKEHCSDEQKAGQTEEQFIYKTRKKSWGPFKEKFWNLPSDVRERIGERLETKFAFLFEKLAVAQTDELVRSKVRPSAISFRLAEEIEAARKK